MACNCNTTTSNICTCPTQYNAKCTIYRGATTCGDIVATGDTLEEAVQALATAICDGLPSPSGETTVVTNVANETTVSSSTVGSTTTYTVGIADAITDQIDENTADIADLQDCCDNSIWTLVTNTSGISVTETGAHEWTIDYSPSGECSCSGMFINDTTGYSPDGTGGTQTVYSSITNISDLAVGDKITLTFEGMQGFGGTTIAADTVQLQLYNGATLKYSIENGTVTENYKFGYSVVFEITPTDIATGACKLTSKWFYNGTQNGTEDPLLSGFLKSNIQKSITGLDFSAFKIQVNYINDSEEGATYNKLNLVSAELIKAL